MPITVTAILLALACAVYGIVAGVRLSVAYARLVATRSDRDWWQRQACSLRVDDHEGGSGI